MSSVARLLLVRHGRTEHNVHLRLTGWGDPELDALGLAQARLVGRHIAQTYHPGMVFSSPLLRALETARQIGRECGREPIVVDALKEIHFGDIEGLTETELATRHPDLHQRSRALHDLGFCWPNGESRWQFNDRIRAGIEEVVRRSRGQTAVVSTHGGVIANLLSAIDRGTSSHWPEYLPHNCSVTEVEAEGDCLRIVRFDDVSFLPEHAQTTQFVVQGDEG